MINNVEFNITCSLVYKSAIKENNSPIKDTICVINCPKLNPNVNNEVTSGTAISILIISLINQHF